jgi:2-methylcitrate dehydratase PrpD
VVDKTTEKLAWSANTLRYEDLTPTEVRMTETRSGALTMWKGCAAPAAARASITATELAMEGMTGQSEETFV